MENFFLNAQHSGAINHHHTISFNSSVVDVAKEVRLAVTVIVVGWIAITSFKTLASWKSSDTR